MRTLLAGLPIVLLAACASSSIRERGPAFRYGLGPDLRVFADSACLTEEASVRSSLGFVGEVVTGAANIAVKSFGKFLEEVGSPEVENASGVHSGMYLDTSTEPVSFNPELRCIYVVRDGFQSKEFDQDAPDDLKAIWQRLELTGTPSLFAMIRIDQADDGAGGASNHIKASLLEFTAQRFVRAGAEGSRDYIVTVEFVIPGGGRKYTVGANGDFAFDPSGPFATGGFPLRGVNQGDYLRTGELKGLETGWMTGPPLENVAGSLPVNLYVDIVEMKRGNPLVADFGRFLQSQPVASAAEREVRDMLDSDGRRREQAEAQVEAEQAERNLVNALEEEELTFAGVLDDDEASPSEILSAVHAAEGAVTAIEQRKRQHGWRSTPPDALMDRMKSRIAEGRQKLTAP